MGAISFKILITASLTIASDNLISSMLERNNLLAMKIFRAQHTKSTAYY